MTIMTLFDLPERFQDKISPEPNTGCWLWTGCRSGSGSEAGNGYGYVMMQKPIRAIRRAHRVIYEMIKGPILGDLTLDHLCRTKVCVNPDHLEPVTQTENTRRYSCLRVKCDEGHDLSGENLRIKIKSDGSTHRICRICQNKYRREMRARKK